MLIFVINEEFFNKVDGGSVGQVAESDGIDEVALEGGQVPVLT